MTRNTPRRPKGLLEKELILVCNDYVTGVLDLGEAPCLTPYKAARYIAEKEINDAVPDGELIYAPPSAGAISSLMKKWERADYANVMHKPFGFTSYTPNAYRMDIECADDLIAEINRLKELE